jgi:hypothetical protein
MHLRLALKLLQVILGALQVLRHAPNFYETKSGTKNPSIIKEVDVRVFG